MIRVMIASAIFLCAIIAAMTGGPVVVPSMTLHDGTEVIQDGEWTVYRYTDGWECRWIPSKQDSGRCTDKDGNPVKMGALRD